MSTITDTKVEQLKLEAKQLKKSANIKHTAALARIAHREGFSSLEALIAKAGGAPKIKHGAEFEAEKLRRAAQFGNQSDPTNGRYNCAGEYIMPKKVMP